MAEKRWTPAQSDFIDAPRGPILVSAAAGSGKTSAIVERVSRRLCDGESPLSADKLLMTTFSNAAAAEMLSRIETKLYELSEAQSDNTLLSAQIEKLGAAQIGTIHSFCLKIIRENFSLLDLSCDFRIADSAENEILMYSAVDRVIKNAYAENDSVFYRLIENVCSSRNDAELSAVILKLYKTLIAMPFPLDVLEAWREQFVPNEHNYQKLTAPIVSRAKKAVNQAILICQKHIDDIADEKMSEFILEDLVELKRAQQALDEGNIPAACSAVSAAKMGNRSLSRKMEPTLREQIKLSRENIRNSLADTYGLLCDVSYELYRSQQEYLLPIVSKLFDLVKAFLEEFAAAKRGKNLVDFNDAEQFMLSLLWEKKCGEYVKTKLAKALSMRYDEIYIDEYQDVNAAQEMIFKAIEPESKNVFMVGDIKQGIYGFRQADADIFEDKKQNFFAYDSEHFPAKIFFDNNFRSREGVTDFINEIFFKIMIDGTGAGIYTDGDSLKASGRFPESDESAVTMLLHNAPKGSRGNAWVEIEAKLIANEINKMVKDGYRVSDGGEMRACRYGDFCILSRADSGRFSAYSEALERLGIDVVVDKSNSDFLESREMLMTLSILKAIDNPYDDVSLCSAMMSPVFLFAPSDLAEIRKDKDARKLELYTSVKNKANAGNQKCIEFLKKLAELRKLAAGQSVDELLSALYDRFGIYWILGAQNGGEERMNNLDMLRYYARHFEKNGYRGLGQFLRFIEKTQSNKDKLKGAVSLSENQNAVKIMTAHKSKGLEFPICILANTIKPFYQRDTISNTLISKDLGFACRINDVEKSVRYSTVAHKVSRLVIEEKQLAEEMRLLYVSMTRAKEKLILPIVNSNIEKLLTTALVSRQLDNDPAAVLNCNSWAQWIVLACVKSPSMRDAMLEFAVNGEYSDRVSFEVKLPDEPEDFAEKMMEQSAEPNNELVESIRKAAEFKYPYLEQTGIANKFSVSEISKSSDNVYDFDTTPDFMFENSMTGAQRGTALHTFMQFADFERARKNIPAELGRIESLGHITKRQREVIDEKKLKAFFESRICDRILKSDAALREYKFMTGIDSVQFGGTEGASDTVMLQGVADCVIIEGGEATIIDYKTDFVKEEAELIERYAMQLSLYKQAIEKLLALPIRECIIYSFCLGKEIVVDTKSVF